MNPLPRRFRSKPRQVPADYFHQHLRERGSRHHVIAPGRLRPTNQISLNMRDETNDRHRAERRSRFEEANHLERIQAIRVQIDYQQRRRVRNKPFKLLARSHSLDLTSASRSRTVYLRGEEHIVYQNRYFACHGRHSTAMPRG